MIVYLLQGTGYGFVAAAQPGPFQAFIISQTLKNGWRRTLIAALAPLLSDGPIIAIVLLVLSRVPVSMQGALHLASGVFLFYLALTAFRRWRTASDTTTLGTESGYQSLGKAVVMNFISPGPWVFWSLVAGPTLVKAWRETIPSGVAFLCGFYLVLIATFALTIVLFGTARKLGPRVTHHLFGISALALAGFGCHQLLHGLDVVGAW